MTVLLGPDGEPIRKDILTQEMAGPEMAGVRSPLSEHPSVGLTPEGLALLLREAEGQDPQRWFALAEEMEEKEPQYLATLGVRKRSVAQLEITVDPASESARDIEIAKFIEQFIARDSLEDELFDIMDAIGKGQIWIAGAQRSCPAGGLVLAVQELRHQRLGAVRRTLWSTNSLGQISCRGQR